MSAGPAAPGRREVVVEPRSIDHVPRAERHGRVWHQGPFWYTGNFVLPTLVTGTVGPALGLSVGWCIVAVTLGACFGTVFTAFHANQGPRMGLPGNEYVWHPVLVAVSIVIAVGGHDLLHVVQRWLTYVLIAVFAVLTVLAVTTLDGSGTAGGSLGWDLTAFLIQLSLAAGYDLSYAVYVSDYTRYLPEHNFSVGPVAEALGGADVSFVVGLLVAGVLYLLFTRNLDLTAERARSRSVEELQSVGEGSTGVH